MAWIAERALALALAAAAGAAGTSGSRGADSFAWTPPALTRMDTLFLIAATGEPRFQAQRDSCEKLLVAAGAVTLDYLIARRLTLQTPRQRHYVERLFTVISDSGRHPEPVAKLQAALPGAPDSVQAQLLRIGSMLGDTAFLPVARRYLRADSVEVRKVAVRSLGTYPRAADLPALLDGLDQTRGLEKQQRLWALGQHPPLKEWPRLLPTLRDEWMYNRQLARQILAKACGGDWTRIVSRYPGDPSPRERLEWVLLALEMPGPASRQFLDREIAKLDPAAGKFIRSSQAN